MDGSCFEARNFPLPALYALLRAHTGLIES